MLTPIARLARRLAGLTRPDRIHREVAEEMAFHIDTRAAEYARGGMSAADARAAAERTFGNVDALLEAGYVARGGSNILKQPSALAPMLMSLVALATVALHVARYGGAREADEGTSAHIWQLLMALQMPVMLYFAARWFRRSPGRTVFVLALQALAAVAALLPVFLLGL